MVSRPLLPRRCGTTHLRYPLRDGRIEVSLRFECSDGSADASVQGREVNPHCRGYNYRSADQQPHFNVTAHGVFPP